MKTLLIILTSFFSFSVFARVIYVDECTIPFDFTIANFCVLGTLGLWVLVPLLIGLFFGGFNLIIFFIKEFLSSLFNKRPKTEKNYKTKEKIYESSGTHVQKNCPNCNVKMRLPRGKVGKVTCPSCKRKIYTSTL